MRRSKYFNLWLPERMEPNDDPADIEYLTEDFEAVDEELQRQKEEDARLAEEDKAIRAALAAHKAAKVLDHPDGSVTDAKLGERSVGGVKGMLGTLLEALGSAIRAATGADAWNGAPATTLKAAREHMDSRENPHGVTKEQVGLGNVPNVATNDQTPTYTAASEPTALTSGEKLSTAFGKLSAAVSALIAHLADKTNPHGVTATQTGAYTKQETDDLLKGVGGGENLTEGTVVQVGEDGDLLANSGGKLGAVSKDTFATAEQGKKADDAIPKTGGTFTGWLESGADNVGMMWEHPDGTKIRVRSYKPGNVFQITRERSGEAEQGILNIYKNSADFVGTASAAPWSGVTGKPSSFPPAAHNQGWDTITGKPSTFPPSSHTHDDRYYTESEMNTKLNGKANTSGTYTGLTVGTANTAKACSGNAATATNAKNNSFTIGDTQITGNGQNMTMRVNDQYLYYRVNGGWTLYQSQNGGANLGISSYRWATVFAATGTINTSDRNLKERIKDLDERYLKLFTKLRPISYAFKNGEGVGNDHDRLHVGFIAQEVEAAMEECGITPEEFGGFCKDRKTEPVQVVTKRVVTDPQDGDLLGTEDVLLDEDAPITDEQGQPVYLYSLRYSEFIALNTAAIQRQEQRIRDLEQTVAALAARLDSAGIG